MKDLTKSIVSRQNVLNNDYAIYEIQTQLKIDGIIYEDEILFTKEQLATYFEVDERTIERYFLRVLEPGCPRSRCHQCCCLVRALPAACRWLPFLSASKKRALWCVFL